MKLIAFLLFALTVFPSSFVFASQTRCTQTETFPVLSTASQHPDAGSDSRKLDVIWVIDDSNSMQAHQTNLKQNISHFFKVLDGEQDVDYQMGIVSTGLRTVMHEDDGQPFRLMSAASGDQRKDFLKHLMVGTQGDPDEKGAEAILRFVRLQDDFVRTGSHLLINILTDEDDETEPHHVHAVRNLLSKIQGEGHQVTINLIAVGGTIRKYKQHFQGFNLHFYPLLSDDFSKDLKKMAGRSIGRTILDLELQFDPEKIVSVQHQTSSQQMPVQHYEWMNDHLLRVDLGVVKAITDSNVQVTYQYACASVDRQVSKKLVKRIAEIDFQPNQDVFLHPEEADAIVQDVFEFLKKHENTKIKLIGAVSYSANPLAMLKMRIIDPKEFPNAYRLSKSRAKKIKDELVARGIDPDRIQSKGAVPGFHRHWYSYLLDLTFYDLISEFCLACDIESDRRVIMKVHQK